jgi:carboxylesterase type B
MLEENPRAVAFDLGSKLNCSTTTNSTELVECLRGIDASTIALSSYNLSFTFSLDAPAESGNDDVFLPDHPLTLLQNGDINKMPVIFGVNSGEQIGLAMG